MHFRACVTDLCAVAAQIVSISSRHWWGQMTQISPWQARGTGLLRGTVSSLQRHRLIDFSLHHFELHWDLIAYCESLLSPSLLSVFLFFSFFWGVGGVNGAHISAVRTPDLCNYCPGLVYPTVLQPCLCLSDWSFRGITNVTGHYS